MSEFLDFAVGIAQKAGENIMNYHGSALERDYTERTHFKTLVDDLNDTLAREAINKFFPKHGIFSEEGDSLRQDAKYIWVVDGVDGTIGFSTNYTDHFSFAISLCRDRTPILGVINAPKRRELYIAELGRGAICNGRSIKVSGFTDMNKVLMGCDSGKNNRVAHLPFLEKLLDPQKGITCPFMTGCASVPLCLVASGVIHAYLATSLAPEDMAAAVVIVREAGGKVTDLRGEEWRLGEPSILAANPALHQKLSEYLFSQRRT